MATWLRNIQENMRLRKQQSQLNTFILARDDLRGGTTSTGASVIVIEALGSPLKIENSYYRFQQCWTVVQKHRGETASDAQKSFKASIWQNLKGEHVDVNAVVSQLLEWVEMAIEELQQSIANSTPSERTTPETQEPAEEPADVSDEVPEEAEDSLHPEDVPVEQAFY